MWCEMNPRKLTLIIVFTSLTVVLLPRFSGIAVPSFIQGVPFQIWEIVVIVAFFLLGLKSGVAIAVLFTVIRLVVSPAIPFIRPLSNLVAILSTLLGVFLAYRLLTRKVPQETPIMRLKLAVSSTVLGLIFRVGIMLAFLYAVALLLATPPRLLTLYAAYDFIVALYTIPPGYLLANLVNRNLRLTERI
jgi:hypothetical protein